MRVWMNVWMTIVLFNCNFDWFIISYFVGDDSPILVEVTTDNVPTINQPLTLQCSATTVRGITSRVDIIWRDGNTQVRRQNNLLARSIGTLVVYSDLLVITSSLSVDDIGRTFECEVVINSIPATTVASSITIPFPAEAGM